ncbi:MAG: hypothetical protein JXR84_28170, partial [Anaerolineae bacterium]|nr:hypothetical protein [Anaerolineae bacterium]
MEADALCDRLVILDHGQAIALDSPEHLKSDLRHDIVTLRTTPTVQAPEAVFSGLGVEAVTRVPPDQLRLEVTNAESIAGKLVARVTTAHWLESIRIAHSSLDDVFLHYTGRALREWTMNRFRLLIVNEFKLARTALPIHLVAILQPVLMYLLMTEVLVFATFDMYVAQPTTDEGRALVPAMREVGSPIGLPYINPILVPQSDMAQLKAAAPRQIIIVESRDGVPTAVQRFGLIDSNQVKNLRNRLTAAALRLWNTALGSASVTVEEHPWLPVDVPYTVYFGLAMLPMATFVGFVVYL